MEKKNSEKTKKMADQSANGKTTVVEGSSKSSTIKVSATIFFIMFIVFIILAFLFRIFFSPLIFLIFMVVIPAFSGFAGRSIYIRVLRTVLIYDNKSFEINQGSDNILTHKWEDFNLVSLVHLGRGAFAVRLCPDITEEFHVDIPVSKLGIDHEEFRQKVSDLVNDAKTTQIGKGKTKKTTT